MLPNTNGVEADVVVGADAGAGFVASVEEAAEVDVDDDGSETPGNTDAGFEPNTEVDIEVVDAVLPPKLGVVDGFPNTNAGAALLAGAAALDGATAVPNIGVVVLVSTLVEHAVCDPNRLGAALGCSLPKANPDILDGDFENAAVVVAGLPNRLLDAVVLAAFVAKDVAELPKVIFGGDLLASEVELPNVSGFMAFVVIPKDDVGADDDTDAGIPNKNPLVSWAEDTGAGTANARLFTTLLGSAGVDLLSPAFGATPKAEVVAVLKSDGVAMELEDVEAATEGVVALLSAADVSKLNLTLEALASDFMPKLKAVGVVVVVVAAESDLLLSAGGTPNLKPVVLDFTTSGTSLPALGDEVEFVIGVIPNKMPVVFAGAEELVEAASVFAGMPNVNPVLFSVLLASAFNSSSFLAPALPKPNVNFEALLVPKLNLGTLSVTV